MKAKNIFLIVVVFLQFSAICQSKKINGVSFVASRDSINQTHIQPVITVNSNHVALMPFGFIRDLASPTITFNSPRQWFGETENGLIQYAKGFQKQGIKIMVKPQIWVWRGEFTGLIEMKSEENWQILEKSCEDFIVAYAKSAAKINAEIFCIGTELEKFVLNRPQFWEQLIRTIRKVYKGKLTYAANWDEYKKLTFWNQLDFIGVDAYFPLSEKETPTVTDFEKGWKPHKIEIQQLQKKIQKPILFTEYGYRSVHFNGKQPWKVDDIEGNINFQAQVNGLQAIHNQFWKEDWFVGGFVWKWFHTHEKSGGKNNNRFTPQNKPAEQLLKKLHSN